MRHSLISEKCHHYLVYGLLMFLFLIPSRSDAQVSLDITPSYGYIVSTNARVSEGDLVIKDSPSMGLTIDIGHNQFRGVKLQLMYNRQDTRMELKEYPSGTRRELFDMIAEYWQIGVVREMRSGKVVPYGVVGLGAANLIPRSSNYVNEWFFAANFGGGIKAVLSDKIALRFQARALLPFTFAGGSLWCGTGGCSIGMGSYSSLIQFDFTAGIAISLGN